MMSNSQSQRREKPSQAIFPDYPLFNTYKLLQINMSDAGDNGSVGTSGRGSSNPSNAASGSKAGDLEGAQQLKKTVSRSRGHILHARSQSLGLPEQQFQQFQQAGAGGVGGVGGAGAGGSGAAGEDGAEQGVFISLVSTAYSPGYPEVGHAITAIALTTSQKGDNLLIRYVGESNVPSVQQIPWSKDFGNKIVGLAFDPSAQWLLAASADGVLCILPAYFLCNKKVALAGAGAGAAMMSAGSTLSTNKPHILRAKRLQGNVSACAWWKPSAKANEYGILGTAGGQIVFINLITGEEVYSLKVRSAVTSLSIVDDRHGYKVNKNKNKHTYISFNISFFYIINIFILFSNYLLFIIFFYSTSS